jgi:hypothetical protein
MNIKILLFESTPIEIGLIDKALNNANFSYIIESIAFIDELENALTKSQPDIILGYSLLNNNEKRR